MLLALKNAEEGEGIIARLIETEGKNTDVILAFPQLSANKAYKTDLVENNASEISIGDKSIELSIKAFGIMTVLLQ